MELTDAWSMVPLGIWGICSAVVLFVLASAAIQRRTIELIHGGMFLKFLATFIFLSLAVYRIHAGLNPIEAQPMVLMAISVLGAIGSLMIVRGLLR